MRQVLFLCILSMASLAAVQPPEEGLKRLKQGNQRFVSEALLHPNRTEERRLSISQRQSPYAVIVTCSDSRVVPEVIFDEGLGDLFVIRVAGNIVGLTELESIEFAVGYLHPVIVVVMGHKNCGAVEAVIKREAQGIPVIARLIEPSVEKARNFKSKDLLQLAVKFNALKMCEHLLKSPVIDKKIKKKSLALYGAYYDIKTGVVEFLNPFLKKSGQP